MANPYGTRRYPNFLARLMANSVILPWSGCYVYMGPITESGYGKITVKENGKEKTKYVHRIAYEEAYGIKLPSGRLFAVRHTCHIGCCWRPDHLLFGSQKQNVDDNIRRGTHETGRTRRADSLLRREERRQQRHLKEILNDD